MKYHEKTFALQQKLLSNGDDREAEKNIFKEIMRTAGVGGCGHMIEYHLFNKRTSLICKKCSLRSFPRV